MAANNRVRVLILMGGASSERPISLATGRMILEALDPLRYEVSSIDTADLPRLLSARSLPASAAEEQKTALHSPGKASLLTSPRMRSFVPDIVFIALHGKGGEDGSVQGLLDTLGIPYTGSGILASALAMDKQMASRLFAAAGLPVPASLAYRKGAVPEEEVLLKEVQEKLGGFPLFVKPNAEGSTFGCSLVQEAAQLLPAIREAHFYDRLALVETYLKGMEITVSVLGNAGRELQALPVIEIVPQSVFYDYKSKYEAGGSRHIIPARLPVEILKEAQRIAVECHTLLGCRGMSRTDMIVCEGALYILETNTIPGMTPTSLLPDAAACAGIPFPALLDRLIASALEPPL